jgi:hypothetical protein
MIQNNLLLKEYVTLIWPILEYSTKHIISIDGKPVFKNESDKHIWYLYRQSFYGFINVSGNLKILYSKEANDFFTLKKIGTELESLTLDLVPWNKQTIFDKEREKLLLEHMYTGSMFRNDIWSIYKENKLSIESVSDLINNNYKVCWITKEENKRLHKTTRDNDVLNYYQEVAKINIINI